MVGSSTAELRLRPTREDDLDDVVAAEADPDRLESLIVMSTLRPEWAR
jgi:hypothetical protein